MKKHNYLVMSDKKCTICGAPLKQNKVDKGHNKCYQCHNQKKMTYIKEKSAR